MENLMVDLETLGTKVGSTILSIGAVFFDPEVGALGKEFHVVINRDDCKDLGLKEDHATLHWWSKQAPEARLLLENAADSSVGIYQALLDFCHFVYRHGGSEVKVWGNGSDFDNAMLQYVYRLCLQSQPWKFWNNRCYRTLKSLVNVPAAPRVGTYHNALDDAKTQAIHAIALLNALK